jgi:HAD superfamily hydrolase (TIGR01549 family)
MPTEPTALDWDGIEAVIFDLDGTLYAQAPLRRRMARELAAHCLRRPREARLPLVLQHFRRARERLAESEAAGAGRLQFEHPAGELGLDPAILERLVAEWLEQRPLPHLAACRAPGAVELFSALRRRGKRIVVFSDYPVARKLAMLGLTAELTVSAVDPEVDRLKPHPRGLEVILDRLRLAASACLMIGDRDERDGSCAERVGMPFLRKIWRGPELSGTVLDYARLARQVAQVAPVTAPPAALLRRPAAAGPDPGSLG